MRAGQPVAYLSERGLHDFDLVLSYTGGEALTQLRERLGAKRVAPLYGSVDPGSAPSGDAGCGAAFSTFLSRDFRRGPAAGAGMTFLSSPRGDRQSGSFVWAARNTRQDFPWTNNIYFRQHLPPADHPHFYCSSDMTLNVTRRAMREMGYCPSGRLFEAAACGVPMLTDVWAGLDQFFTPGEEIVTVRTTADAMDALELSDAERKRIATAARERTLAEHTAAQRVRSSSGL